MMEYSVNCQYIVHDINGSLHTYDVCTYIHMLPCLLPPASFKQAPWGSLMLNMSPSSLSPEAHTRRLPSRCPTRWALQKDLARLMDGSDARRQGARCAGAKSPGIWCMDHGYCSPFLFFQSSSDRAQKRSQPCSLCTVIPKHYSTKHFFNYTGFIVVEMGPKLVRMMTGFACFLKSAG